VNAHPRPYYYLENFMVALDWLRGRYQDLLSDEEQRFMAQFTRLPTKSAALAVRMVMRQGDLFRTSKLEYAEIGCPKHAAVPLIEAGWLDPQPSLSLLSLCRLLRKAEICEAARLPDTARSLRKSAVIELALETSADTRPLREWWPQAPDEIFHVRIAPLCERLRLMFFGNFHQTWSEFVLADLGIFRYESVCLDESARAFQTRCEVDRFQAIYRCRELLESAVPLEEVLAAVPPSLASADTGDPAGTGNTWVDTKRTRLLFAIGQQYEKTQELERALTVYGDCSHPEARIRTIRVLEKLGRFQEAAALALRVREEPANELEIQSVCRILRRLHRRPEVAVAPEARQESTARRASGGWELLELTLPRPAPPRPVELVVGEHLSTTQGPVLYVENTLLNALFGLLCWDAIFAPLPGAFFHAFHAAPADLLEVDFHRRRVQHFATCFARLENGTYRDTILETFDRKIGLQTPFVAWKWLSRVEIERSLDCIPATHLHQIFQRLLGDLRANRSGLPDLIQLWPDERRYRLIEVKGPGDRLQDNQIRWLSFCLQQKIPVCVCKVTWRECQ
jgi:hypothetical protein